MTLSERIESKIERITESGCWIWQASCDRHGYGRMTVNKRPYLAHRVAYELAIGQIPHGMDIDHLCRVRCCVNPAHLEPVTRLENTRRGQNGNKTHCLHGHEYTEDNTYIRQPLMTTRSWRPVRVCRACSSINARKYQSRKKAKVPE